MFGYATGVALMALGVVLTLVPLCRPPMLASLSFRAGLLVGELPFVGLAWLAAPTALAAAQGDLASVGAWLVVALAGATAVGLLVLARRGWEARGVVEEALRETGLGLMPRGSLGRLARAILTPLPLLHPGAERIGGIRYDDTSRRNVLDLYVRHGRPEGAPVLVHFHGGHFRSGRRNLEARPLLHHLARRGWVCVTADYRLRRAGRFPHSLVDAKRVIAWVRAEAARYGADPSVVVVAGSSAGAHLAAMAALTDDDASFQPGFEDADTSVAGAVCLYGYYGRRDAPPDVASSPLEVVHRGAPPFCLVHGTADTIVPVESARAFVRHLHAASASPVVYAELPAAQHSFDLFRTLRFEAVVDGIDAFVTSVASAERTSRRRAA